MVRDFPRSGVVFADSEAEVPERAVCMDVARPGLPWYEPVAYLTQTTLSLDETADVIAALKERFGDPRWPGYDIGYASENLQNAVRDFTAITDGLAPLRRATGPGCAESAGEITEEEIVA